MLSKSCAELEGGSGESRHTHPSCKVQIFLDYIIKLPKICLKPLLANSNNRQRPHRKNFLDLHFSYPHADCCRGDKALLIVCVCWRVCVLNCCIGTCGHEDGKKIYISTYIPLIYSLRWYGTYLSIHV